MFPVVRVVRLNAVKVLKSKNHIRKFSDQTNL